MQLFSKLVLMDELIFGFLSEQNVLIGVEHFDLEH
jgi:hypothetical protein